MSRLRPSSPLSELRALHKAQDVPALRQLYRLHSAELAEVAGVRPSGIDALVERPEPDVIRCSAQVLDLAKHRARHNKYNRASAAAANAAEQLQRTARWTEDAVHLDQKVVLGGLLQAPSKYILFQAPDGEVLVERSRLVRLRRLARRMDGLFAYLSHEALCFRWKGGRAGLNLRCTRALEYKSDVFRVVLTPPQVQVQVQVQRPQPSLLGRLLPSILRELSHNLSP